MHMLPVGYELRDGWPIINGNPLAYLVALRDGMNDSAAYTPGRTPRPESKSDFDAIVARHGGPVPVLLARIEAGRAAAPDGAAHTTGEFLRQLPAGQYFCKPDVGKNGNGAHVLQISATGVTLDRKQTNFAALEQMLSAGPYLVQESLVPRQHPQQARFNPEVINTIRLMVFDASTGPVTAGGFMRLANEHGAVDNYVQGGLAVPLDLQRGVLRPIGYVRKAQATTTVHARSGLRLEGQPVPFLEEAKALVCRLHGHVAMKTLGWDVALLKDGPLIIEANRTWDVHLAMRIVPGFFAAFMRYHLAEAAETSARFDFTGDFPDRKLARHWLCYVLGQSLVSGRLEHLSRSRAVVIVSGSRRGIDATAHRLKHEAGAFNVSKIGAAKIEARIATGFDVEASFRPGAQERAAAAV
jgi:hypothetical protein